MPPLPEQKELQAIIEILVDPKSPHNKRLKKAALNYGDQVSLNQLIEYARTTKKLRLILLKLLFEKIIDSPLNTRFNLTKNYPTDVKLTLSLDNETNFTYQGQEKDKESNKYSIYLENYILLANQHPQETLEFYEEKSISQIQKLRAIYRSRSIDENKLKQTTLHNNHIKFFEKAYSISNLKNIEDKLTLPMLNHIENKFKVIPEYKQNPLQLIHNLNSLFENKSDHSNIINIQKETERLITLTQPWAYSIKSLINNWFNISFIRKELNAYDQILEFCTVLNEETSSLADMFKEQRAVQKTPSKSSIQIEKTDLSDALSKRIDTAETNISSNTQTEEHNIESSIPNHIPKEKGVALTL